MIGLAATFARAEPGALAALESEQEVLFERVAPSVVFLVTDRGLGSGFFVNDDGLILTAAHVVEGAEELDVVRIDGTRGAGRVVERSTNSDLALVDTGWSGTPALPSSDGTHLGVGTWVASVGHGEGGGWSFTTGLVSNLYPIGNDHPVFQTQIPLNPGNSGGPVVDRRGEVVGVVTSGLTAAQNVNFATRIGVALTVLTSMPAGPNLLVVHAPVGVPIFMDGKVVGTGPRAVIAPPVGPHRLMAVVGGRKVEAAFQWPGEREITLPGP